MKRDMSDQTRSLLLRFPTRLTLLLWFAAATSLPAQDVADQWRYTLDQPSSGWQNTGFDDAAWKEGFGGFGTRGTPGARVGTQWETNNIWLRKTFDLTASPRDPALLIHHDEDAEVYLNGQPIVTLDGYTNQYEVVAIPQAKRSAIKVGKNVLAVRCRQTAGGQFIDVHLIDENEIPALPRPKRDPKPFQSELMTSWGEQVSADNAWTEYPRPQLQRDDWTNLNGHWDYAITSAEQSKPPASWTGKILVPFSLESKLSGVSRFLEEDEALWYQRSFNATAEQGFRTLLNFEAVDYQCEVFVNGKSVGKHQGGNTPFSFDATQAIRTGQNQLIVRVEDDTERFQLRGKQTIHAHGIWYTQVSGIWQSVWMERVPSNYVRDLKLSTDAKAGTIKLKVQRNGGGEVRVALPGVDAANFTVASESSNDEVSFEIKITDAKLWSPASPHLYDISVTLADSTGKVVDRVKSYAGIRDVGKVLGTDTHWRFTLNGEPIFHWGPLDQGWWPDGLLTPPSDEAMLFDIQWLKDSGFNMIRKHIKVEPRRYYYHCDRLGMMVWQDQVSGGPGPSWTRLRNSPKDAEWPDPDHQQFMFEFEQMIDTLENHPSIVVWTPFNEAWGQHRTVQVGQWAVERDPSRLINIASGGNFWPVGHVVDAHAYPDPSFPFDQDQGGRFAPFIKVMGEFGGHGYPVEGHLWDAKKGNWGYGGLPKTEAEYKQRYVTSLDRLNELRARGIAAGVYTQTTDVEGEINGLITYDRKVIKIPAEELAELHRRLFEPIPKSDDQ